MREASTRISALCAFVAVSFVVAPAVAQDGDECTDPIPVGDSLFVTDISANTGATGNDSTACGGFDSIDQWFRYAAPADGVLNINTCNPGSEFDTVLSLYNACGDPDFACNDDSVGAFPSCELGGLNRLSSLTIPVSDGQVLLVRLSAFQDQIGTGLAEISFSGPDDPAGEDCEDAIEVEEGTFTGNLADNTTIPPVVGPDYSSCGGIIGVADTYDEWWAYTTRARGTHSVSTCMPGTLFDTVLSVWDGCPDEGGVEIACNDDASGPGDCSLGGLNRKSYLTFFGEEKHTYYIRVSVYNDDFNCSVCTGTEYEIRIAGPSASSADECPIGTNVAEGTYLRSLDLNTGSTGDDSTCAFNDTIDEWFDYTATYDGTARITTCNPATEFDTVLSVFASCGGAQIACNDDTPGALPACSLGPLNRKSTLEIPVVAGTSYQVRVSVFNDDFFGTGGSGHNYELTIRLLCPCDWNDDGNLNDQDFFDWANDYFTQTGPQGGFDFNGDGNENDQDWFDFINCYFTPPPVCGGGQ